MAHVAGRARKAASPRHRDVLEHHADNPATSCQHEVLRAAATNVDNHCDQGLLDNLFYSRLQQSRRSGQSRTSPCRKHYDASRHPSQTQHYLRLTSADLSWPSLMSFWPPSPFASNLDHRTSNSCKFQPLLTTGDYKQLDAKSGHPMGCGQFICCGHLASCGHPWAGATPWVAHAPWAAITPCQRTTQSTWDHRTNMHDTLLELVAARIHCAPCHVGCAPSLHINIHVRMPIRIFIRIHMCIHMHTYAHMHTFTQTRGHTNKTHVTYTHRQ